MIPQKVTLSTLSESLAKDDEGISDVLEAHALQVVSLAASKAFIELVNELRLRGIELQTFGPQTDAELHYRSTLLPAVTSKQLVFALDIVVTVGATA